MLFEKKSKNLKKINFLKNFEIFYIFYEFPEFRINRKYRKPASLKKMENLHVFSRKLVHIFQGKKKDGFKKEMKIDL